MRITMSDPRRYHYLYEESIKTLRTNILFCGRDVKTILFTSCYPNEGKSDIVFQLAREIGRMGKRVLLLDADIRKSSYMGRYKVKQAVCGLSQYLSGQAEMEQLYNQTNFENMDIIFAGPVAPNPSELLEEEAFERLLKGSKERYDYVLVDTPPMVGMTDGAVAAKKCDGAVLVVESEAVSYKVAQKVLGQLQMSGCRILGAVLNKVDVKGDKYYSSYGKYTRYGKYSKYY